MQAEPSPAAPGGAAAGAGASLASSGSQCCHLQGPAPATQHPSPWMGCPGMCWVPRAAPGWVSPAAPGLFGVGFHLSSTSGTFPPSKFFDVAAAQGEAGLIFFPLATGKLRQGRAPTELPLLLVHPKYLSTCFPPPELKLSQLDPSGPAQRSAAPRGAKSCPRGPLAPPQRRRDEGDVCLICHA